MRYRVAGLLLPALVLACSERDSPVSVPLEGVESVLKKGGGPPPPDGAQPARVVFADDAAHNIRSDAELRADSDYTGPEYADGICGVVADMGNFDDARLDPDAGYKSRDARTCGIARALIFEWDSPVSGGPKPTRVDGIFMNIDQVMTVTGTEFRKGQFNVCGRLIFDPDDTQFPGNGSSLLQVTFDEQGDSDPGNDRWIVATRPYPDDVGLCASDGTLWRMPFRLEITRH